MSGNVSVVMWARDEDVTSWSWDAAHSARGVCLWSSGWLDGRQWLGRWQLHGSVLWRRRRRPTASQSGRASADSTWHGTWHHRWHVQYTRRWSQSHVACQQVALSHIHAFYKYFYNLCLAVIEHVFLKVNKTCIFSKTEVIGTDVAN